MKRRVLTGLLVVALSAAPAGAMAAPVATTGPELVSMESGLDGESVILSGEAVSEAMAGGDGHAWVNVLSDGVAIGVWMPRESAREITTFGRWSATGDMVRIAGVFNEACDVHGGDLDVHATSVEVTEPGKHRQRPVVGWKLLAGIGSLVVAGALIVGRSRPVDEAEHGGRDAWRRRKRGRVTSTS